MTFSLPAPGGEEQETGREGVSEGVVLVSVSVRVIYSIRKNRETRKEETLMNVDNKDPNLSSWPLEIERGFSAGQ